MSQYTFTFKKGDIFVEFTTADREMVEKQFQIWVACADEYARNKEKGVREKGKEREQEGKNAGGQEENISTVRPFDRSTPEEVVSEQPQSPEFLDKASNLLRTINTIQEEEAKGKMQIAKSEDAEVGQALPDSIEIQKENPSTDFEEVLEQSIENPTFEPAKTQDKVFLNLVNSKNTTDNFHYLIITAYYLSEFEKQERFSLKQINAKLMHNLSVIIDHATLQEAINQNFIELVPDLTGMSEVAEYRLTRAGEDFFANAI